MKSRKRPVVAFFSTGRTFRLIIWGVVTAAVYGFVRFSAIAEYRAAHLPPDYVHPWDVYALLCILVAMGLAALALLTRREAVVIYHRIGADRKWQTTRPRHPLRPIGFPAKHRRRPRPRHRSPTNPRRPRNATGHNPYG